MSENFSFNINGTKFTVKEGVNIKTWGDGPAKRLLSIFDISGNSILSKTELEEGKKWTSFKSNEDIVKNVSHWYGDYTLPSDAKFAKKGTTNPSNTDFNKYVDGYVILLFKIESQTGNSTYLKYDNVWSEEGMTNQYVSSIQLPKTSVNGTAPVIGTTATNLLADGYAPIAIYQANISTSQNYDSAGTH